MRQKTYWTSQTVTAHKDGRPSLLVTTSLLQGGPVTLSAASDGRKEGVSGFGGKVRATWWGREREEGLRGHPVTGTTNTDTHCQPRNKIPNKVILSDSINKIALPSIVENILKYLWKVSSFCCLKEGHVILNLWPQDCIFMRNQCSLGTKSNIIK